ncbi:DUF192 domain-containing protein [Sphingomonas sp. IC-56]|uniref:DUF192 domain-containing protein n=1 Tax=Sphingomonas sp. IC-56 TaxID=2898529 RepID=UPI001E443144|nr:DUF192 domain-containing protein [Sphingomonas sp. IC-56]MCD2322434.1 DUF192 domain-containing protein [Sphingomonas sp. IC-56]
MGMARRRWSSAIAAGALLVCGCATAAQSVSTAPAQPSAGRMIVTVQTASGPHQFKVEVARTQAQQSRGLMFRTDIPADGGMLFVPYPAEGPPREASFWMKNTPSPLDIIFIRKNGTIASIAANVEPFSETPVKSGEVVSAVLEINGGRAAELGIRIGDTVRWAPAR